MSGDVIPRVDAALPDGSRVVLMQVLVLGDQRCTMQGRLRHDQSIERITREVQRLRGVHDRREVGLADGQPKFGTQCVDDCCGWLRDPADLVSQGDFEDLKAAIEDSAPLLQFRIDRRETAVGDAIKFRPHKLLGTLRQPLGVR